MKYLLSKSVQLLLIGSLISVVPQYAFSQSTPSPKVTGGIALNISQPRGEFDETTNTGWGLGGNFLFRLDPNSIFNIRSDISFQSYGNTKQRVPLSSTTGNLIKVDLKTSNNIASVLVGPQLLGPSGVITPWASALGGFSVFWTSSSVEGSNQDTPFATTTNSSDMVWAYGGAAGAYIRVRGGDRPVHLELGARYLRHDDVTYLTPNEVRLSIQENREPIPLRSRADYYTWIVGIQGILF